MILDASQIAPRLWQGSRPPEGRHLHDAGIDVLVLCALEHQPPARGYPGVEIIRAPMDDSSTVPKQIAESAARLAAIRYQQGRVVLVACNMGRNRSGLVSALVLWLRRFGTGKRCADRVRSRRAGALTNPYFYAWLARLPRR